MTDEQRDELTKKLRANPRLVRVESFGQGFILPGARPLPDPEPEPEPPLALPKAQQSNLIRADAAMRVTPFALSAPRRLGEGVSFACADAGAGCTCVRDKVKGVAEGDPLLICERF